MTTQDEYMNMSDSEKQKEDWMNSKWRPMMGWLYMLVCLCDFVVFPVLWGVLHAVMHSTAPATQWQPLTLQGAGLFHLAMGAVLGLAAWGRTQEKLGGANNGGLSVTGMPGVGGGTGFGTPSPTPSSFGNPAPAAGGFGGSSSFGASTPAAPAATKTFGGGFNKPTTATSSCGRAMPMQDDDPVL